MAAYGDAPGLFACPSGMSSQQDPLAPAFRPKAGELFPRQQTTAARGCLASFAVEVTCSARLEVGRPVSVSATDRAPASAAGWSAGIRGGLPASSGNS